MWYNVSVSITFNNLDKYTVLLLNRYLLVLLRLSIRFCSILVCLSILLIQHVNGGKLHAGKEIGQRKKGFAREKE